MYRSFRQEINKKARAVNDTLDQIDVLDIFRAFHPKEVEYPFFLSAHVKYSRMDHMLGHKTSLNKF